MGTCSRLRSRCVYVVRNRSSSERRQWQRQNCEPCSSTEQQQPAPNSSNITHGRDIVVASSYARRTVARMAPMARMNAFARIVLLLLPQRWRCFVCSAIESQHARSLQGWLDRLVGLRLSPLAFLPPIAAGLMMAAGSLGIVRSCTPPPHVCNNDYYRKTSQLRVDCVFGRCNACNLRWRNVYYSIVVVFVYRALFFVAPIQRLSASECNPRAASLLSPVRSSVRSVGRKCIRMRGAEIRLAALALAGLRVRWGERLK